MHCCHLANEITLMRAVRIEMMIKTILTKEARIDQNRFVDDLFSVFRRCVCSWRLVNHRPLICLLVCLTDSQLTFRCLWDRRCCLQYICCRFCVRSFLVCPFLPSLFDLPSVCLEYRAVFVCYWVRPVSFGRWLSTFVIEQSSAVCPSDQIGHFSVFREHVYVSCPYLWHRIWDV